MMTTNLFFIANVKQLRTDGSFRMLLPFFQTSWNVGLLNSAIFNSFHNRVEFGTISEGLRNFLGGGGLNPQPPPPRYAAAWVRHVADYSIILRCCTVSTGKYMSAFRSIIFCLYFWTLKIKSLCCFQASLTICLSARRNITWFQASAAI